VVLGTLAALGLGALLSSALGQAAVDEWLGVLLYLPLVAWVLVMVVRRGRVQLGVMFRWPRLGAFWWVVAGMLVVQFLFSIGAVTLTQLVFPGLTDALDEVGQGNLVLALVGLVVLPPLVEETVFRGVLLERFAVKWSLATGIVVSAIAFGLLHVDPIGAGMFGVVTALLYLRTGSLWPGILVHAVNNLVALTSMRLADPQAAPEPTLQESLVTAAVSLALSIPFLVWFIRVHWPRRGTCSPYQWHEWTHGLPERHVQPIAWSAAPGVPLRLTAGPTHLLLGPAHVPGQPIALLPLEQLHSVYPTGVPGGQQVVVLLRDGSWTTLQASGGLPAPNEELALVIRERAASAAARAAAGTLAGPAGGPTTTVGPAPPALPYPPG
jgi:membrane protease YdiL (CAAX protease family)